MCILSSIHVPCSVFEIFVRPICYQKPLDFRLCHFPLDFCVCCCLLKFIVMLLGNPVECTASVNMPYYGVYFVSRSLFRGASFSIRFSFSHLIKGSPFSICREQLFCVPFFSIPISLLLLLLYFLFLLFQNLDYFYRHRNIVWCNHTWKWYGTKNTVQIWWCFIWNDGKWLGVAALASVINGFWP